LRSYIHKEALKQFNKDYDVLYQVIKNEILADGESVNQKIVKYAESPSDFFRVVNEQPLLTIFVPELPNLHPSEWDPIKIVPSVAVAPNYENKEDVKAFFGSEREYEIPYGLIPSAPTFVVKDNERVIITKNVSSEHKNEDKDVFFRDMQFEFSFAEKEFNGLAPKKLESVERLKSSSMMASLNPEDIISRPPNRSEKDSYRNRKIALPKVQHIINAMESGAEWNRDNIYYGISSTVSTGALKRNIKEYLTAFRFYDAEASYNQIGLTPGDPQPLEGSIYQNWAAGSYEFRITALINTRNGPGLETQKVILVKPSELFKLKYKKIQRPRGVPEEEGSYFWEPYVDGAKLYTLPQPLVLETWDLENMSYGWKITFSKYNLQQTVVTTETQSSEYATNFEINIKIGEKEKVGAKFGGSAKFTDTQTHSYTQVIGPAALGDANIYFSDPVWKSYSISGNTVTYDPYELQLGTVYLTIEPRQM